MQTQTINNQYIIRIEQSAISLLDLQRMLDYLRFKSIVTRSQATDAAIDQLADEITQSGWEKINADFLSRISQ